jgi:hypothetical protein
MTLAIMAIVASNALGAPCAAINNTTDHVAWKIPGHTVQRATYRDAGDHLVYSRWVPRVVHMAAATLEIGIPGPKTRLACRVKS